VDDNVGARAVDVSIGASCIGIDRVDVDVVSYDGVDDDEEGID